MNKIVLNKPLLINKKYVVYFDSDNKFIFRNKREAADFIVKVGREIEESVLFITEEFNCLEEFYRLYYLADKDYKFKFALSNSIDFLNNRLAWMLSHEGSPNHDVIVFQSILNCIDELKTAFCAMFEKAAQRKDTITKRRCALKAHIIEIYKDKFLSIGIKPKEEFLKVKKASKY
jgi:hypothetical protein